MMNKIRDRLISTQMCKKEFYKLFGTSAYPYFGIINNLPLACNIGAIIAEMEARSYPIISWSEKRYIKLDDAIDIVQRGGIIK